MRCASLKLEDPELHRVRTATYPWRVAMSNLVSLSPMLTALADLADWETGEVLDAGCGPGVIAASLEQLGPRRVVAVDASPVMLAAADELGTARTSHMHVQRADITELPFDDDRFDVVFSGDAPMSPQVLRELWRVLRPGGTLVVKRTGVVGGCTFVWDPVFELRICESLLAGMAVAGPPWSTPSSQASWTGLTSLAPPNQRMVRTVIAEATSPMPPLWAAHLTERFATFEGPFIRAGASEEDWARVCALWDPRSPARLTARTDAYIAETLTLIAVHKG